MAELQHLLLPLLYQLKQPGHSVGADVLLGEIVGILFLLMLEDLQNGTNVLIHNVLPNWIRKFRGSISTFVYHCTGHVVVL